MTKKDYELIAKVFNDFSKVLDPEDTICAEIARALAEDLAGTNPRFNREMFLTACGVEL